VDPISVVAERGAEAESRHRVHVVGVLDGQVTAAAGDPDLVTFMRSSAKPFQALPLAEAVPELPEEELAIACASHDATPEQLDAVRALLRRSGATEDDLECGTEADAKLRHNCSGKHAGMLAVCRARGWPTEGYRLADHPLQRELLDEVARAAGESDPATAVDGCGVVTFALPLRSMAHAFARLEELDGCDRITAAMRAHPALIRGGRAADTMLMQALPGWIAKGGAEGLMCAAGDGLGVALKAEDGAARALRPALAAFLGPLGHAPPEDFAVVTVENSRGERVGEIVAVR
jgi:L-asparaginase II